MVECSKCGETDKSLEYRLLSDSSGLGKWYCELCLIDMMSFKRSSPQHSSLYKKGQADFAKHFRKLSVLSIDGDDNGYECAACGTTDDAKSYVFLEDDRYYCGDCAKAIDEERIVCARCANDDITISYVKRNEKWYCSKCCAAERVESGEIFKDVHCNYCGAKSDELDYFLGDDGCWYCGPCTEMWSKSYVEHYESFWEPRKLVIAEIKIEDIGSELTSDVKTQKLYEEKREPNKEPDCPFCGSSDFQYDPDWSYCRDCCESGAYSDLKSKALRP